MQFFFPDMVQFVYNWMGKKRNRTNTISTWSVRISSFSLTILQLKRICVETDVWISLNQNKYPDFHYLFSYSKKILFRFILASKWLPLYQFVSKYWDIFPHQQKFIGEIRQNHSIKSLERIFGIFFSLTLNCLINI